MGRLAEQPVVHFVELAGVTSPEGVVVEVGDVLGVRESIAGRLTGAARRTDLLGRILDQVGTAPALLILDNCEHLVDAVADLVQVLVTRTPALRVLTTTRAPLGHRRRAGLPAAAARPRRRRRALHGAGVGGAARRPSRHERGPVRWSRASTGCRSPSSWPPPRSG